MTMSQQNWLKRDVSGFSCMWLAALLVCVPHVRAVEPCRINVIEQGSGWPVPLVELRTTNDLRFVSDNAGVIAFDAPELMGVATWFSVKGHGYNTPADGFGFRGVRLTPEPGKTLTVTVERQLPAKRLGRITGGGIFAESQKLGLELEWRDQGVLGCDSVQNSLHDGKLHWAWGDTNLPGYALGLFHTLAATTAPQPLRQFQPPVRMRFNYFRDSTGKPREVAKMPGDGPTWISGSVSLPDQQGRQRLVAHYVKVKKPMIVYESGLCVWDDEQAAYQRHRVLWNQNKANPQPPAAPSGHSVSWTDDKGKEWVLFGDPFPTLRCARSFEAWSDPAAWQQLRPQAELDAANGEGKVVPHRGSIAFHPFKKKWAAIFTQLGGESSFLGEIWYAEADSPTGPWGPAIQVVTHDNYTFYNPRIHPEFTPPGSSILIFEGTYTNTFAKNNPPATPRHNYNQILYRLDLDDPALKADR